GLKSQTIPIVGTAKFTRWLRTFEKVHATEETASGTATWRSRNIKARPPAIIAIEAIPTDQASLEAVLGFIVAADSGAPTAGRKAWRRDSAGRQTCGGHACRRPWGALSSLRSSRWATRPTSPPS